jgi:hypothetical protein
MWLECIILHCFLKAYLQEACRIERCLLNCPDFIFIDEAKPHSSSSAIENGSWPAFEVMAEHP